MGYRDEKETLRARVSELEGELSDANETIGRLTGLEPAAETGTTEERSKLLGSPKLVRLERELDLSVSDEGLEKIAELLRKRGEPPGAVVSQVGRTLTMPGFSLTQRDGMTQISMTGDYRQTSLGALSGGLLLGGFSAMAVFALVHDLFIRTLAEAHVLWMAPIAMLLTFALLRGPLARAMSSRAESLKGTFESVVELAKRHRVREVPRVRVDADAEEEEEVETDDVPGEQAAR